MIVMKLTINSMPYKAILTFINIASCYWSLYKYATYFAKRHAKIVENEKAIEVVMRLQEDKSTSDSNGGSNGGGTGEGGGGEGGGGDAYGGLGRVGSGGTGRKLTVVALDGAAIRRMTAASVNVGVPMDTVPENEGPEDEGRAVNALDVRAVNAEPERDIEKAFMEEEEEDEKDKEIMPAPGVALG